MAETTITKDKRSFRLNLIEETRVKGLRVKAGQTTTQTNMARITTYEHDVNITDADKVIGTDAENADQSKNYTIGGIKAHVLDAAARSNLSLQGVGLNFKWSLRDPSYRVDSDLHKGEAIPLVYTKLRVDFQNLVLEDACTYKLVVERHRRPSIRTANEYRKGGYKKVDVDNPKGQLAGRLSEIDINAIEGQKFDFKWDHFFRVADFPCKTGQHTGGKQKYYSDQMLAFKIKKTNADGSFLYSPILGKLAVRGIYDRNLTPNLKRITFINK